MKATETYKKLHVIVDLSRAIKGFEAAEMPHVYIQALRDARKYYAAAHKFPEYVDLTRPLFYLIVDLFTDLSPGGDDPFAPYIADCDPDHFFGLLDQMSEVTLMTWYDQIYEVQGNRAEVIKILKRLVDHLESKQYLNDKEHGGQIQL